ncbi:XrtA system polysaccharide deacetylase [Desulfobacula phenolica]|uniref:Polysaccharide deacetylase family protein, PEP-CTERM locus subfamily n=1 Tax=Desulfobacula phenolica TaxID=90732 RepID=A0A1H2ENL2_9BACT|nr:XrtA system polysaccharide deacetylase [Desulfobacula phenolica]SDT96716.1 polysaccharide deacetylase family protein, PEP-CTERM locus subfamily [Desulfobacula phenolica]
MASAEKKLILLTFDVEDWFQVENFKEYIEFSTWDSLDLRVEKNILKILDLLDSFPFKPKATFFILGWIAQKLPGLVRQIHKRGHEIASHGFDHSLCKNLTGKNLFRDLKESKNILEKIIGNTIFGFRAPSFAVTNEILNAIEKAGYTYDSSFNSFSGHGRYGTIDLSRAEKKDACYKINNNFFELPVSNMKLKHKILPLGGGGYFRLFPFCFFKIGMKEVLKKDNAFVFYAHPWEFDISQPRVEKAAWGFKFRHYINLHKTERKFRKLVEYFSRHKFVTCMDYINYNHLK